MNKNSRIQSKLDELKKKAPPPADVEKKLIPRLKLMGYIMYGLGVASALFAMISVEEKEPIAKGPISPEQIEAVSGFELLMESEERELTPKEVLNFYLVGGIFVAVGAGCFLIAWKKKKVLGDLSKI